MIVAFLGSLLKLNNIAAHSSLWPERGVDELQILVVFPDGSISAYGIAAYIRWAMRDNSFWSCLIMGKSKIAPKLIIAGSTDGIEWSW